MASTALTVIGMLCMCCLQGVVAVDITSQEWVTYGTDITITCSNVQNGNLDVLQWRKSSENITDVQQAEKILDTDLTVSNVIYSNGIDPDHYGIEVSSDGGTFTFTVKAVTLDDIAKYWCRFVQFPSIEPDEIASTDKINVRAFVILNCPTEGVVAYTPRENATVLVYWSEPYDKHFEIDPSTAHSPGIRFGVGVTMVDYFFPPSAHCMFNVTVLLQCAEPTDIPCGNGVCVPFSYDCDGYNDCADSPSGSDEKCPINSDCIFAAPMLYPVCADRSDWINATNATATPSSATEFRFSAPADATDTTRLFEVRVNRTLIDLGRNESFSVTLFITISSLQTASVPFYINAEQFSDGFFKVGLRNPLIVQPNEQIRIYVVYDYNNLTDRPSLVGGSCSECVELRYATLKPGCQDGICLDAFYAFRNTLNSSGVPCGIPEQNEVITSLYETCFVNCTADQSSGVHGNLTFPQTRIGQTAESVERCPPSTARAGMARATRECIGNMSMPATWMSAVTLPCSDQDVNSLLENLAKVEVTRDNVEAVAKDTAQFTSNHTEVNATGIISIADILWNIVDARSPSSEVAVVVVEIVNNVLQVEEEEFDDLGNDNSPSRIVLALEAYITALQLGDAAGNLTVEESDVALAAVILPRDSVGQGLGFAALPEVSEQEPSQTDGNRINVYYNPRTLPVANVKASITLPSAVQSFVTSGDQIPISFFFYANSKLFRSPSLRAAARPDDKFRRALSSSIIAATVEGVRVENLPMDSPIVSAFLPLDVGEPEDTVNNSQCVFWNFTLNDGFGDWSGEGCRQELVNNSRTICHCDHLTSFAVIVDVYGNQDIVFLSIISKIGCAVSVVALIITIVTYLAVKKLHSKRPQQILINLCFALLGLYLVFLIGIEATESGAGCAIVAVLIHYFTLASLAWMAVEAANMYLLFVKILNANVSHFLIKASIAGWGLPLVVVVVILAVDHTNYMDESTTYCFLRPDYAFYFGQVLPIALVLLFNAIVFTLVMRQLTCARKGISSSMERSKRQEMVRRLTNAICITVLLGLTWVFGLLSLIQVANFVFQVFFCIFNSLQGLMIFILFCARQTEVQQAWLGWLQCCRKGRSDDYSAGTATRSRNQQDSQALGTLPLTANSTNTTNTT